MTTLTTPGDIAVLLAEPLDACRRIALEYRSRTPRSPADSWTKTRPDGTAELVTIADRHIDLALTQALRRATPAMPVVSEESWPDQPQHLPPDCWIIDPIDGTRPMMNGSDQFTICVAAQVGGRLTAAAVDFPAHDVRVYAARGAGSCTQGDIHRVLPDATDDWLVSPVHVETIRARIARCAAASHPRLHEHVRATHTASIKIIAVALGLARAAVMPDSGRGSHSWDLAAAVVIAREAGLTIITSHRQLLTDPLPWHIAGWAVGRHTDRCLLSELPLAEPASPAEASP